MDYFLTSSDIYLYCVQINTTTYKYNSRLGICFPLDCIRPSPGIAACGPSDAPRERFVNPKLTVRTWCLRTHHAAKEAKVSTLLAMLFTFKLVLCSRTLYSQDQSRRSSWSFSRRILKIQRTVSRCCNRIASKASCEYLGSSLPSPLSWHDTNESML